MTTSRPTETSEALIELWTGNLLNDITFLTGSLLSDLTFLTGNLFNDITFLAGNLLNDLTWAHTDSLMSKWLFRWWHIVTEGDKS